jgi:hypothetical protein
MKRVAILLCLVAFLLLGNFGNAVAVIHYSVSWDVVGGGGGHAEAGNYALDSTIGQSVVGTASLTNYSLCSGFWCKVMAFFREYLPLLFKD